MDKLKNEQYFIITAFCLSLLLSFLFGYLLFRYEKVELCKRPMEVVREK